MPRSSHRTILRRLRAAPRCSVAALRALAPECGRNALAAFAAEFRTKRRRRLRRALCRLLWNVPGAVWAIDGTWLEVQVLGTGRRLLVVADLGAKATLACRPIRQECAEETLACLRELLVRHGPPLVIKVDNGPGFIAKKVKDFCTQRNIVLLHSPPRRPQFNGAIEARVRWAKHAVLTHAIQHGRLGFAVRSDLRAAVDAPRRLPDVPLDLRRMFRRTMARELRALRAEHGLAAPERPRHAQRARLRRVAAQRALEECHILTIRRPEFRPWFRPVQRE